MVKLSSHICITGPQWVKSVASVVLTRVMAIHIVIRNISKYGGFSEHCRLDIRHFQTQFPGNIYNLIRNYRSLYLGVLMTNNFILSHAVYEHQADIGLPRLTFIYLIIIMTLIWMTGYLCCVVLWTYIYPLQDNFGYGLSQWKTTLHCNIVLHWLSQYPAWPLYAASSL